MNEKLSAFLGAIVKYGGANLVIFLVSAWYFNTYFFIEPGEVQQKLSWLLTALFFETIFVMAISRIIWTMEKFRDFKKGKTMSTEANGKPLSVLAKDTSIELLVELKEKLAKTPEEKEIKRLEKKIKKVEKEIGAMK